MRHFTSLALCIGDTKPIAKFAADYALDDEDPQFIRRFLTRLPEVTSACMRWWNSVPAEIEKNRERQLILRIRNWTGLRNAHNDIVESVIGKSFGWYHNPAMLMVLLSLNDYKSMLQTCRQRSDCNFPPPLSATILQVLGDDFKLL